jgi:hypothetical protein
MDTSPESGVGQFLKSTSHYYIAYLTAPDGKRKANIGAISGLCAVRDCPNETSGIICFEHQRAGWNGMK